VVYLLPQKDENDTIVQVYPNCDDSTSPGGSGKLGRVIGANFSRISSGDTGHTSCMSSAMLASKLIYIL